MTDDRYSRGYTDDRADSALASPKWLPPVCLGYAAFVVAVTLFSVAVFVGCSLPLQVYERALGPGAYELALARAEEIAEWSALASAVTGGLLIAGCLALKTRPPHLLVNSTLASFALCTFAAFFLPAIVKA